MSDTTLLPGANSPQVLTRLLEGVARGVRTTRGLQEALGVGVQTVRAYVQAAAWLSLVDQTDPVALSPLGLEYVYAGPRRPQVYARAVWSTPLAADLLMASDGRLPELEAVERTLFSSRRDPAEPGLADATLRRRASAVRGLLAPAVGRPRPRPREQEERQLGLPLEHAAMAERPPALMSSGGPSLASAGEYDPDVYRYILACLLDHGELSLGHLRALLDRAGAQSMGLGGLIELARSRGDALRVDDRLVASAGAAARRDLASQTASVMLSDPTYRQFFDDTVAARADRAAAIRRDPVASRFRAWDRRLFGRVVRSDDLAEALQQVVLDRPVAAFPIARPDGDAALPEIGAFLDRWEGSGVRVALPPSTAQLLGGVAAVNRVLQRARGQVVGLPDLADRPVVVHGGIIHPGEPVPRTVPDARTLRQRVLMHAPYCAVAAALLLLHRLAPDRLAVTDQDGSWVVRRGDHSEPLLDWIDGFGAARGWVVLRRRGAGLPPRVFVDVLEAVGIATAVGRTLVLSEPLFARLQTEAEEREIHARLQPLVDAAEAHLHLPAEEVR
jgi:hypothetical protein